MQKGKALVDDLLKNNSFDNKLKPTYLEYAELSLKILFLKEKTLKQGDFWFRNQSYQCSNSIHNTK